MAELIPISTNIFDYIGRSVQSAAEAYALSVSQMICTDIMPPLVVAATTIYIMSSGYMIAFSHAQQSINEFIKRVLFISLIAGSALLWGQYDIVITNTIFGENGGPGLEQQILEKLPLLGENASITLPTGYDTIYNRLDRALEQGASKARDAHFVASKNKDQNQNIWSIFFTESGSAFVIGIATVVTVFCAGALIIMAKLAIAILIAVGPLFIFFLLYPATRRYFDKWLGQLFTYLIAYLMLIVITVFGLVIFTYYLTLIPIDVNADIPSNSFSVRPIELLIISLVILYAIKQVPQIASSLCSGAGLSSPMSAYYAVSSPAGMMAGKKTNMPGGKLAGYGAAGLGRSGGTRTDANLTAGTVAQSERTVSIEGANAAYTSRGLGNKGWDA